MYFYYIIYSYKSPFELLNNTSYLITLKKHKEEGHFPFRYLCDENQNIIPIVLVSAFFRDDKERNMYNEYINNNIEVVGITAYKSFPKPITDNSGDSGTINDTFDYYKIKNWLSCFKEPSLYGFDTSHHLAEISESDFYDAEILQPYQTKKYDFIYICLKDDDKTCPMDGWNAINRNFKLALNCFPVIIEELGYSVLVVGRVNCGLEKIYGDKITVIDFLPHHEFQEKMREARYLFIPNIYDASPRVISEALIKNIPVLINRGILCGHKYINKETGEFFTDENDIRLSIKRLTNGEKTPNEWWKKNYSRKKSAIKMRNILYEWFPQKMENINEVYFY